MDLNTETVIGIVVGAYFAFYLLSRLNESDAKIAELEIKLRRTESIINGMYSDMYRF